MYYAEKWLVINVKELKRRSVRTSGMCGGNIILVRGKKKCPHIDLIKIDGVRFFVLKEKIINYDELKAASNLKKRMSVFLDAVRDINIHFYVDNELYNLIMYGVDDE